MFQLGQDIASVIMTFVPFGDLASLGHVCRMASAAVRAEIIRRIGRNYHAITTVANMNDLANFAYTVIDPEAYVSVAKKMLSVREKGTWHNKDCLGFYKDNLFCHWIHIGLPSCARLLIREFYGDQFTNCHYSDQEILFYGLAPAIDGSCMEYLTHDDIKRYFDELDAAHFNLVVDYIRHMHLAKMYPKHSTPRGRRIIEDLIRSNHARPRYVSRGLMDILDITLMEGPPLGPDPGPTCTKCGPISLHRHGCVTAECKHADV